MIEFHKLMRYLADCSGGRTNIVVVLLLLIVLAYAGLRRPDASPEFFCLRRLSGVGKGHKCETIGAEALDTETLTDGHNIRVSSEIGKEIAKPIAKDEIDEVLERASMENKTLVIAFLNKAYVGENGMLNLFLESLREGENTKFLINHLLLVAVDDVAYNYCRSLQLHCYQLMTKGFSFSKEAIYMSKDFIQMMWRRTQFLGEVLRRGYNFIFTDMDVLWLHNPFKMLNDYEDLQISCDNYHGLPYDEFLINTGFYFVIANNKTTALFDKWYAARNNSAHMKDQDVLLDMRLKGGFQQLGLVVRYLDTQYFSGFCQKGKDFTKVVTMHANCCIGAKAKLIDLRAFLEAWKTNKNQHNGSWPAHRGCFLIKD